MFSVIVATDNKMGIAKNGRIPWFGEDDAKLDMKFFKETTENNFVIMGRKTYESIGKPLKNRHNIVISETMNINSHIDCPYPVNKNFLNYEDLYSNEDAVDARCVNDSVMENKNTNNITTLMIYRNVRDCVKALSKIKNKKLKKMKKFVIGGSTIYKQFLEQDLVFEIYHTKINKSYDCDLYIKYNWLSKFKYTEPIKKFNDWGNLFHTLFNNKHENAFLHTINRIMTEGNKRSNRTGVTTLSCFDSHMSFDLSNNNFPLLTTRRLPLKHIFEELMLLLRGQTDSTILERKNINIWKGNTRREFLDNRGFNNYPEGDMGHSYGMSMRHFGAEYIDCKSNYTNSGFDQLNYVIQEIKTNPTSRRIMISLWEPHNMHKAALPPCLFGYQFYVCDGKLSCKMMQRSSDIILAGGWNVAFGALMTYLIAHYTDLKPDRLIWTAGDVHIYENQFHNVPIQLRRTPKPFPKLYLKDMPRDLMNVEFDNIELLNYNPCARIKFVMNA